jgi:hypothetical protein
VFEARPLGSIERRPLHAHASVFRRTTCLRVDPKHQEASPQARLELTVKHSRTPSVVPHCSRVLPRGKNRDFDCGFDPAIQTPEPIHQELPPRDRLSTIRAGSFKARPCPKRPIPRGLHPAFLEPFRRSRSRFVRPTSAIEPSYDEYPRCVRLTAASTSLWLVLHRPILRRVFADESRVSRRPTRFDDFSFAPRGRCLHHVDIAKRNRL